VLTLSLDTSTRLGSVALARSGELLAETSLSVRAAHSETVMPEIERVLRRCGEGPGSLDAVVVGAGPGSFTGVRIAASLAKGLCAARGATLYAFSSLEAVAMGVGAPGRVCALFDARRGQVYAAAWSESPPADPILGPVAAPLEAVLTRLGPIEAWSFSGDGAVRHRGVLEARGARVLSTLHAYPRAAALLELVVLAPDRGLVSDRADWEPTYVRSSGAERGL
jgi:tRNA threonylcarbamoyladenosine biosynthesis protein TsaB